MQRVAHILRKYDPAEWGGTETHVAAITRSLLREGWRSELHAPHGPTTPDTRLASEVAISRFHAFCPFLGSKAKRQALYANAGNLATFEEPWRLYQDKGLALAHLHTCGRIGGSVRTAILLSQRPYVVSVHGPMLAQAELLAADTQERLKWMLDLGSPIGALFGARRVLDDAARVIVFNQAEHRAMQARVGHRAVLMDHGVEVARFSAGDSGRANQRWPFLGEAPLVVVVGRLSHQKNQLLALRAFAAGAPSEYHLAFAGATTDLGYQEQLEQEIKVLGLGKRAHLLGNIEASAVPDLLARAQLLLAPSTHEAFGLVLVEAWAAGCPSLTSVVPGFSDMNQALGPEAPVVSSLDPKEWAQALGVLLKNVPKRQHLSRKGKELAQRRYRWERISSALASLYQEVTQEKSLTPGGLK